MDTKGKRTWRDSLESILVAIFLALLVRTFVVSAYRVPTSSMSPTLLPGDFIFSYKIPYGVRIPLTSTKFAISEPNKGEVVVFTYPDRPSTTYVKRVVGLPGDRIEIIQGVLYVNSVGLTQSLAELELQEFTDPNAFAAYKETSPEGQRLILRKLGGGAQDFGPIIVPPNEVFLLGDHRDASDDSRYWGTVPTDRIEGRVFLIWLSLKWQDSQLGYRLPQVRWNRLFETL